MQQKVLFLNHNPIIFTILGEPLQHLPTNFPQKNIYYKLQHKLIHLRDVTEFHQDVPERNKQTQGYTRGDGTRVV